MDGCRRSASGLRRIPARRRRHRDLYEPVLRAVEAEQLIERERHELADLSHEWSEIGRWFAAESGRIERHPKAYRALQRAERDLAQLASLGGDVSARRRWFYRDPRRRFRYPQQWAESKRDAKALREQEAGRATAREGGASASR